MDERVQWRWIPPRKLPINAQRKERGREKEKLGTYESDVNYVTELDGIGEGLWWVLCDQKMFIRENKMTMEEIPLGLNHASLVIPGE